MIPKASAAKLQSARFAKYNAEEEWKSSFKEESSLLEMEINLATMEGKHELEYELTCSVDRPDVVSKIFKELDAGGYAIECLMDGDKIKGFKLKWD